MRLRSISFFIGMFLWQRAFLVGQENETKTSSIIAVSDYSAFLEAMASASQEGVFPPLPMEAHSFNDLGDPKMMAGSGRAGVLMRSGEPGSYRYQVVTSKPNAPVPFLSWDDAFCYGVWRQGVEGQGDQAWEIKINNGGNVMDHALRSNHFLFQLVDCQAVAHEAAGEEVMGGALDEMLEAILGMSALTSVVPREGTDSIRGGEHAQDLISHLSPAPTLHLTIAEDAEQQEMNKIFTQALTKKAPNYYAASDALMPELERAWKARAIARQQLQVKEEALEQAQAKFKEEEEALVSKNIEKTALGRIANATGKTGSIVSGINLPLLSLSGFFQGASTLADIANRKIEKHSFKQARAVLEKAAKEAKEARQHFDACEERAFALDTARKKPEEEVWKQQQEEIFQEARRWKPPFKSNQEHEWQEWAEVLLESKASRQEIVAFAQKAKAHSNWTAQRAAQAWGERINRQEQRLRELEEKYKRESDLLEVPYALAQEKAQEARDTATAAYERQERMIQAEADAHEEYDTVRELLRQLEAQKQRTATLQQSIEQAKNETQQAYEAWERAKSELEGNSRANQFLIYETEESARQLEEKALKLYQEKEMHQKKCAQEKTRAQAELLANQRAWREIWPEEVLSQKLQDQRGWKLFETALKEKSEIAWGAALQEAEELVELWGKMQNREQQKVWRERAKRAAIKKAFVQLQERWGSFADAVQTFIENPNFASDFKNSQQLAARGEEVMHAIEEMVPLSEETLVAEMRAGMNPLSQAIRNVVNVAKLKTNSSKPLEERAWKDVVKMTSLRSLKVTKMAPALWQEEATWMAQAVQEAGIFAKNIAEPGQDSNKNRYLNPVEFQELGKALAEEAMGQMRKMYQKQIRYMRARRNLPVRALEGQKSKLLERKKSFYKKDRRWKGERGLLEVRKKLISPWRKQQEKSTPILDTQATRFTLLLSEEFLSEKTVTTRDSIPSSEMMSREREEELTRDIVALESRLVGERLVLDQEKNQIDQKEQELQERTIKLEQEAKVLDHKAAALTLQAARMTEERIKLEQEKIKEEKGETSKELVIKIAALQTEETRILQEREALAKEAESLGVLASIQVDQKTWNRHFKKLHRLIEQEKEAGFKAQTAEGVDVLILWNEAHHIAVRAQEIWEEIAESITQEGEERKNAQREKEIWEEKAKGYFAKAVELARAFVSNQEAKQAAKEAAQEEACSAAEIEEINGEIEELKRLAQESEVEISQSAAFAERWYQESRDYFNEAIEYLHHAMRAVSVKDQGSVGLWKEAAALIKQAGEHTQKTAGRGSPESEDQTHLLNQMNSSLRAKARNREYLAKAKEAAITKKVGLAELLEEIADYFKKAAEAYTANDEEEANNWNHGAAELIEIVDRLSSAAEKLERGREAEEAGKLAVATTWREAAALQERSVEFYKKAVNCSLERKEKESAAWFRVGSSLYAAGESQGKEIEAEEEGRSLVAQACRIAAALQEHSVKLYERTAEAYSVELYSEDDENSQDDEDQAWFWEEKAASRVRVLTSLSDVIDSLETAIETEEKELLEAWSRAVEPYQHLVECYQHAADATGEEAEHWEERAAAWEKVIMACCDAARRLDIAIETERFGNPAIAKIWREAVATDQHLVESYQYVAEACAAADKEEAEHWEELVPAWERVITARRAAVHSLEVAIDEEEAGESAVLETWHKAATSYQEAAKYYEQEAQRQLRERENHGDSEIFKQACLMEQAADCFTQSAKARVAEEREDEWENWYKAGQGFFMAAEELRKALEDEEAEKSVSAKARRDASWLQQHSAEYYQKAAEEYALRGWGGWRWRRSGECFLMGAEKLGKAIAAMHVKESSLPQAWSEVTTLQEEAIKSYRKAAEANVLEAWDETWSRCCAGEHLFGAAEELGKALEAEETGKPELVKIWRDAAALHQYAVEFYQKAVEAYADGNKEKGEKYDIEVANLEDGVFDSLSEAAANLTKAMEAEVDGRPELAKTWREAVALPLRSIEFFKKSVSVGCEGRSDESRSWFRMGWGFCHAGESLGKALEAEEAGKPEVAKAWHEVAVLQEQSVEFFKKELEASLLGKEKEARCWAGPGDSFLYSVISTSKKAIEAEEAGKPEMAKAWREAATLHQQSIEFYKKAAEAYAVGEEEKATYWEKIATVLKNAADSLEGAASKLESAIEAEEAGKSEVAKEWRDVVALYQQVAALYQKAAEVSAVGEGEKAADSLQNAALSLRKAADSLETDIESEEKGKPELAKLRREATAWQQQAAEFYQQAVEVYGVGKEKEGDYWHNTGDGFFYAAEKLEGAIEAEEEEQLELAKGWRKAAALQRQSVEFFKKTAVIHAAGKEEEAQSWANVGHGFFDTAEKLKKAIESEGAGKLVLAKAWREAAALQQQSINFYKKVIKAYAAGNGEQVECWEEAGEGFFDAAEKLKKAIESEEAGKLEVAKVWRKVAALQKQSVGFYQKAGEAYGRQEWMLAQKAHAVGKGLSCAAKNLEKAIAAEDEGNLELAKEWRNTAKRYQRSVDYYQKAMKAYAVGKKEEALNWSGAGEAFFNAAEKLEEAIEAEAVKPELARVWSEAAVQQEKAAAFYQKTAEAYARGKEKEALSWRNIGEAFFHIGENLRRVINADQVERPVVAEALRKAVALREQSVEFFKKAAEAYAREKEKEALSWHNTGEGFFHAAENLEKGIEAEEKEKPVVAKVWRQAAMLQKQSSEFFKKAAEALNKKEEAQKWYAVGQGFSSAAEKLRKAIEAEDAGKSEVAKAWRQAAALQEQSVEFYKKAAEADSAEQRIEVQYWDSAGQGFFHAGESLGKAISADEMRSSIVAEAWRKIAALQEQSVEFYQKAAETYVAKKFNESSCWNNAGKGLYAAAEKLGKGIEAEDAEKSEVAKVWRQAAALQEQSMEFYKKAVEACVVKRFSEKLRWVDAGKSLYAAAEKLVKGIESEEEGKPELAKAWREAAVMQQRAVEFYQKAAEAYAARKKVEAQRWHHIGKGFYNTAEKLEKGIAAEEIGRRALARAWREVAVLEQQSVEFHKKVIEADAANDQEEVQRWEKGAVAWEHLINALNTGAISLEKAIAAEEIGEPELADAWRAAVGMQERSVEFYQKATEAHLVGNTVEAAHFEKGATVWERGLTTFCGVVNSLEVVLKAKEVGRLSLMNAWSKAVETYQHAVDFYQKTVEAYAAGHEEEAEQWEKKIVAWEQAVTAHCDVVRKLHEAIEAEEAGKLELAKVLHDAVEKARTAAEEAFQAAGQEKGSVP